MKNENNQLVCDRCKKIIEEPAYVLIQGSIVMQFGVNNCTPNIFKCPEHAENYAKTLDMHPECFMDLLKEYGAPLHNMTEVLKKLQEQHEKALLQDKQ